MLKSEVSSAGISEEQASCNDCISEKVARSPRTHARPAKPPIISLDQPGRLRVANVQALLGVSHTTVYRRIGEGLLPPPDGWDLPEQANGRRGRPYWNTSTIKNYLKG